MNSFRFDQAGRLLFGSIGALRVGGLEVHGAWAKRALKKTFPQVHEVAFGAQWYGMMGMTGNALPRFHRLAPNVVTFCGYNGRGIGTGTVFGRLLAEHVLRNLRREGPAAPGHRPGRARFSRPEGGLLRGWRPNRPRCRRAAVSRQRCRFPGPRELARGTSDCLDFNTLSGYPGRYRCSTDDSTSRLAARRGSLPH